MKKVFIVGFVREKRIFFRSFGLDWFGNVEGISDTFGDIKDVLPEKIPYLGIRNVLVLPDEIFSSKIITIPVKQIKKVRNVIFYELEDALPFSDFQFDYMAISDRDFFTLFAKKEDIEEYINLAVDMGFDPDIVVPEIFLYFSFLSRKFPRGNHIFLDKSRVIFLKDGKPFYMKGGLCEEEVLDILFLTLENEGGNLEIHTQGVEIPKDVEIPYEDIEIEENDLLYSVYLLEKMPKSLRVNFRGKKRRKIPFREEYLKKVIFPAALSLVLLFDLSFKLYIRKRECNLIEDRIERIVKDTLSTRYVVDPVAQLKSAIREKKEGSYGNLLLPKTKVYTLLLDLSEAIPKSIDVKIEKFTYTLFCVEIFGETGSFENVDKITKAMEKLPYFSKVTVLDSRVRSPSKKVIFKIRGDFVGVSEGKRVF